MSKYIYKNGKPIPVRFDFYLDGQGVIYKPHEPLMLDGLDYLMNGVIHGRFSCTNVPQRDTLPIEHRLSFVKSKVNGIDVYHASALIPANGEAYEDIQFFRKRFNTDRITITEGAPVLTNGQYRDYNIPYTKVLTNHLVAYGLVLYWRREGQSSPVSKIRSNYRRFFKHIGKKGLGKVINIDVTRIENDWSMVKDGYAMRFLPVDKGVRLNRVRPPYWNSFDMCSCCRVGDRYELSELEEGEYRGLLC